MCVSRDGWFGNHILVLQILGDSQIQARGVRLLEVYLFLQVSRTVRVAAVSCKDCDLVRERLLALMLQSAVVLAQFVHRPKAVSQSFGLTVFVLVADSDQARFSQGEVAMLGIATTLAAGSSSRSVRLRAGLQRIKLRQTIRFPMNIWIGTTRFT